MKRALIAVASVLFMVFGYANADERSPAPSKAGFVDSVKEAGREIRRTAQAGGKAVKKGAKEAWRGTRRAAAEAGRAIKHGAERAREAVRETFHSSPKKA